MSNFAIALSRLEAARTARRGRDQGWTLKMFAKPGAPYSVFYAVAVDDVVWISPNIPARLAAWIGDVPSRPTTPPTERERP